VDAMGDGSQDLYLVMQQGHEVYDTFGIELIGGFSSESLFIHFKDDAHMQAWRSKGRSIEFTALDYAQHLWEGVFNLNRDEEQETESDNYSYAFRDMADADSTDDYEAAVQDATVDTETLNDYESAVTDDFIEYSMINMGIGGTNAQTLTGIIESAGESHSLDMTVT
jgi:hypothetical protein